MLARIGLRVGHLHQVDLMVAGLEPGAGEAEVGAVELLEAHHVRVEAHRRLELFDADGHVVETRRVHLAMVALMGEMIEFPSNGGTCPGYLATPESGSGPGVIVIQEWWGLVPHIKDVADRFAKEGFVALAPDLYRGKAATEPDEAGKYMMALDMAQAAKDLSGAVDEGREAGQRVRRRRRRVLHGRRARLGAGVPAPRQGEGGVPVLRRHPVARGAARLEQAQRLGRRELRRDGFVRLARSGGRRSSRG